MQKSVSNRKLSIFSCLLVVCLAWLWFGSSPTWAQQRRAERQAPADALFYNFYVGPEPCGSATAALYPCPRPTPPLVGHTYVTYQPLMPHEFMYKHCRIYLRNNPGAGWTCTKVHWKRMPFDPQSLGDRWWRPGQPDVIR